MSARIWTSSFALRSRQKRLNGWSVAGRQEGRLGSARRRSGRTRSNRDWALLAPTRDAPVVGDVTGGKGKARLCQCFDCKHMKQPSTPDQEKLQADQVTNLFHFCSQQQSFPVSRPRSCGHPSNRNMSLYQRRCMQNLNGPYLSLLSHQSQFRGTSLSNWRFDRWVSVGILGNCASHLEFRWSTCSSGACPSSYYGISVPSSLT